MYSHGFLLAYIILPIYAMESFQTRPKEALENNTVYLQEIKKFDDNYDCTLSINIEEFARLRIMHYAKICGMKINEKWDYNRYAAEFSGFLYNKMRGGIDLEQIFGIKQLSTQEGYRRNIFC